MELGGDEIVNVEDNFKNTPLHLGALNENEEIVEVLLAHGADVNKLNSDQESVLHWSSINGEYIYIVQNLKNTQNALDFFP